MKQRASTENINGRNGPNRLFDSIFSAAEHGNLEDAKYYVNLDANVVKTTGPRRLRNALHLASMNGHLDIVRYLLTETEIDVNSKDVYCQNSLHLSTMNGHLGVVRYLLTETKID
eukprot:218221_1